MKRYRWEKGKVHSKDEITVDVPAIESVPLPPSQMTDDENMIYDVVEQMPTFAGKMTEWLAENIKYPADAATKGIEGRVIVQVVVNKDGSLSDLKVVRGVDDQLNNEALRVVKSMPKWNPGEQAGKPVRCKFMIPVFFRL